MSIDPAVSAALIATAGALAGYGIRALEIALTARSRNTEASATARKTALNGYAGLTDRLQTRLTHVEAQLDATNQRLARALDRIQELENVNTTLERQIADLTTALNTKN